MNKPVANSLQPNQYLFIDTFLSFAFSFAFIIDKKVSFATVCNERKRLQLLPTIDNCSYLGYNCCYQALVTVTNMFATNLQPLPTVTNVFATITNRYQPLVTVHTLFTL